MFLRDERKTTGNFRPFGGNLIMEKIITTLIKNNSEEILAVIKLELEKGNYIKFTHSFDNLVKVVTKWNLDDMGDMEAEYSTGRTKYVCPDSVLYKVEIISKEEFEIIKNERRG